MLVRQPRSILEAVYRHQDLPEAGVTFQRGRHDADRRRAHRL